MLEKEKKAIVNASRKLVEKGLLFGSWGNISMRKGNRIAITPSGIPYDKLRPSKISVMEMSGKVVEGPEKSSEWRMHVEIYKNTDAKAIIHSHSKYASVFAVARKPVKSRTEDSIQVIGDNIPVARYFLTGTKELAFEVAEKAKDARAVIMANHGIVVHGRSMEEAVYALEIAEKMCMVEALSRLVGKPKDIPKRDREILKEKYSNYSKHFL